MKKIVAILLGTMLLVMPLAGCNRGSSDVKFWVYGDEEELEIYSLMTQAFNDTYGKEHGIHVDISNKPPANYDSLIQTVSTSKSGPDVFLVVEDYFKKWVNMGFLSEMTEYIDKVDDIDISDVFPTTIARMRYNIEDNTSDDDDPLYGLPLDTKPTAIYYNESLFEKAGILVISVNEEDMDAWNAGEIADLRGKTRTDYEKEYPKLVGRTIPKKGYYRSLEPYFGKYEWQYPAQDELLVFNNRIAMNWDEIEDLGMLFSPEYNSNASSQFGTDYGFFTEWWFNYGWSVGGDCLTDLTGNGDWNFSLLDKTPNYYVNKDGYVGEYTGTVYKKGETLSHLDKFDIPAGELMVADNEGGYTYNGAPIGIRQSIIDATTDGHDGKTDAQFIELPSTREAFTRYLRLGVPKNMIVDNAGGLKISPNPLTFSSRTRMNYFYSGKMAMLIDYSSYMSTVAEAADERNFKWDIAPLVVYKEYVDPEDPDCDDVIVVGKQAGQSNSKSMVSRAKAANPEGAARFMMWMTSREGQRIRAINGHFPNQRDLLPEVKFKKYAPGNVRAFSEALEFQGAGDWWYMADYEWINVWAVPLNSEVRNARMEYDVWWKDAIPATNAKLLDY